tara:strand:+ start:409 stop:2172 length:1764 start_codon:yes stop_codon:yes gene_type:complete
MKIPTYKSKLTMTSDSPNVESNIQLDPAQNIYRATKSVTNFLTKEYVKEAKLEADNKATLALNELFINQEDGTKGFYSIQAETKTNGNPNEAAQIFDNDVNKLWQYAQNNKLQKFDSFTKKALERKFYATAGLFKAKGLEGSRNQQISDTKKITDDLILKETTSLVLNGVKYLDTYKNNVSARLTQTDGIEEKGILQKEKNTAFVFGELKLGQNLAAENPYELKNNIDKFTSLDIKQKSALLTKADETILNNNKLYFTDGLNINEDTTAQEVVENYEEIINQTFNGNIEKIKLWQSLPGSDKTAIIDYAKQVRRQNTAEINNRNNAILNQQKDESINKYRKFYQDTDTLAVIDSLKINDVFGEPKNSYEAASKLQIVELSTKIGQKEFSNVNDYYKNFNIQKAILTGQVKDHITPFTLDGETEPKSITERVGNGISKKEFGFYLNYLLPNTNNPDFINSHKKLYTLLESLQPVIEGPNSLKYLDTTLDNRLNNFQSQVIFNFTEGLKKGLKVDDMLNPKNKLFIGKNWQSFQPDKDYLTKIISEKSTEATEESVILPPPWNPDKYKTVDDWLNSKEYQEYLQKKKEQ